MLKKIILTLAIIFLLIQLYRPERTNPVVEGKAIQAPEHIALVLKRACYDCHSNETAWPWYSNIAPISYFTIDHVNNGRKELNFSEWETYKPKRKAHKLEEMVEMVRERIMPLPSYLLAHKEAELSDEDIRVIITWAEEERSKFDEE
ncbi:MAG: heme-binding domain-containing protein [Ignavibacteriales bacterium]|nr:heme-binding domain-containing protein [Ignavibacteriales bacterium]